MRVQPESQQDAPRCSDVAVLQLDGVTYAAATDAAVAAMPQLLCQTTITSHYNLRCRQDNGRATAARKWSVCRVRRAAALMHSHPSKQSHAAAGLWRIHAPRGFDKGVPSCVLGFVE
jgi:hypothetical protein